MQTEAIKSRYDYRMRARTSWHRYQRRLFYEDWLAADPDARDTLFDRIDFTVTIRHRDAYEIAYLVGGSRLSNREIDAIARGVASIGIRENRQILSRIELVDEEWVYIPCSDRSSELRSIKTYLLEMGE